VVKYTKHPFVNQPRPAYTAHMKRLIALIGLASLALLPANLALAAGPERITSFDSVATLSQANVLTVTETIKVDFGSNAHHGIFRDVPIVQRSTTDNYYYTFKLLGVSSSSGAPAGVASKGPNGDYYEIKIGDPNQTIQGQATYVIRYELTPLALRNGDVDRVNLNVTGQDWEYPIDHASLALTLPAAPTAPPVCYTGSTGSQAHNCTVSAAATTVSAASSTTLEPGNGMTVDINLPGGSFSSYLRPNQRPPLSQVAKVQIGVIALVWLTALAVLGLYFSKLVGNIRLRRQQIVVAQYEAPDGLSPGQIGLLVDSKSGMKEFTATVMDLAVRGYLKITRLETKVLFYKRVDYQFDQLGAAAGLKNYEHSVYDLLFKSGDVTKMSELSNSSHAATNKASLDEMRKQLGSSLTSAGYYGVKANLVNHHLWLSAVGGAALLTIGIGILPQGVAGGLVALLAGAAIFGFACVSLGRYPELTDSGAAEWAKVEGFKLYLSVAEKDRLNFTDAPERTPELFNKLLPYAVALGVEKQWAKQFDGIDVTPSNGWYAGSPGAFNSAAFTTAFATGFASSMSSSFAASGGSGGAGGGGGGGGGGGW
jgi:hypothetical protein